MSEDFMKAPCKHCPFRSDVRPFLHPDRASDIAYAAQNPYSDFSCHKTTEYDEEGDDMIVTNDSKTCAGFLAMQVNEGTIECPEGFKVPENVYSDIYDMTQAYEDEWNAPRKQSGKKR